MKKEVGGGVILCLIQPFVHLVQTAQQEQLLYENEREPEERGHHEIGTLASYQYLVFNISSSLITTSIASTTSSLEPVH